MWMLIHHNPLAGFASKNMQFRNSWKVKFNNSDQRYKGIAFNWVSDVTLVHEDDEKLEAHKVILAASSPFLQSQVHSWYIPGLGIKMDCVPGRSTHHNIYINHYGFYYGQCAEICGRYHHHMPIRVCALPFEHFLIWWHSYAVNVYINFIKDRAFFRKTSSRFYAW